MKGKRFTSGLCLAAGVLAVAFSSVGASASAVTAAQSAHTTITVAKPPKAHTAEYVDLKRVKAIATRFTRNSCQSYDTSKRHCNDWLVYDCNRWHDAVMGYYGMCNADFHILYPEHPNKMWHCSGNPIVKVRNGNYTRIPTGWACGWEYFHS